MSIFIFAYEIWDLFPSTSSENFDIKNFVRSKIDGQKLDRTVKLDINNLLDVPHLTISQRLKLTGLACQQSHQSKFRKLALQLAPVLVDPYTHKTSKKMKEISTLRFPNLVELIAKETQADHPGMLFKQNKFKAIFETWLKTIQTPQKIAS